MLFSLKTFDQLSVHELYSILRLRSEVFVVEQTCVYQDMDGLDEHAQHLFNFQDKQLLAYCRIIPPSLDLKNPAIGRVVVDPSFRGKKLGQDLMRAAISKTFELFKCQIITISAQKYLLKFYSDLGFKSIGESYLEDGIPHIKMEYNI